MPRFPVAFNRRKSTADNLDNASVGSPSFRVLDRSEVFSGTKNFDAPNPNARLAVKSQSMPNALMVADPEDDNIFANLNVNRLLHYDRSGFEMEADLVEGVGSGSSNTTKTTSDDSSRHSNVSTAPSSADLNAQQQQQQQFQQQFHQQQQQQHQEDYRLANKKLYGDVPVPPIPKSNTTSSFLKSAGRTFSFGGNKKNLPILPNDDAPLPQTPPKRSDTGSTATSRDRSLTESTVTTATPPKLEEGFTLDLGGDFSKMLGGGFDKRASVMTVREDGRPALVPRSLTGNRLNQPTPIHVDGSAKVEPSPYSWGSQHSNEQLLNANSLLASSPNENAPPVPRHAAPLARPQTSSGTSPNVTQSTIPPIPTSRTESSLKRTSALFGRRRSTIENAAEAADDEDTVLLKDSLSTVNRFLAGASLSNNKQTSSPSSRFGRRDDALGVSYSQVPTESTSPTFGAKVVADNDDNLFDTNLISSSRTAQRFVARKPSPPRNKVMTPAQFERYRKDKEREESGQTTSASKQEANGDSDDDDDKYEDDEDEAEKSRQAAKQRRKQEAHMSVYRQQMMKVTGEAASGTPARSSMHYSLSTPNLPTMGTLAPNTPNGARLSPQNGSENEGEDEDEEVPLAILAAHGFPSKNRPPARLSTMMSNPNLRAAAAPSFQRPQSIVGSEANSPAAPPNGGRLPVFARNLPQDPYGLVNSNNRETLNFAGGAPAVSPQANSGGLPPGGLVGVIASEERSRAMRRGSPNADAINKPVPHMGPMGFGGPQFDPAAGIPPQMMYPGMGMPQPMLTPGDQAQIQMTQQMQQFMQMQMQFMQMMANGGANGMQRPMSSQYGGPGGPMNMGMMGGMDGMNNDMGRHSFVDNGSVMDMQLPHPDMHMRTMSMVQPNSASWMQQPQGHGYAPSIRIQGANAYAPSIAPSERSNVGLPGRYRPVSHVPAGPAPSELRKSMTMSGAISSSTGDAQTSATSTPRPNTSGSMSPNENNTPNGRGASPTGWDLSRKQKSASPLAQSNVADDDDDEQGWAAMKARRDKKRSIWKSKKTLSSEIGALIS
ncbi:hypothetical protein SPBR_02248 [Sporothrix brasiliensis 5110]|uniref:Uncharacterized protein n=1 Tax=Sporothrix brasiliensis 5110 TaxID=1398154 RepID=A0A0C2J160_9PEZI|nr:uncharacterized protein SPBR_02248 [Sporothrix brasiliensis 5110]KIH92750.1 hypothetical protein SPBR_02248 [Sporothrix brasiliensis 5110]